MRTYRFTHHLIGAVVLVVATILTPQTLHAQGPAQPTICTKSNDISTRDVTGVYENKYMQLLVDNCGNARLLWENSWGVHAAYYKAETRAVKGGGVLFFGIVEAPTAGGYMDDTFLLVMRPAEPMWITLTTYTPMFAEKSQYRLYRWEDL